MEAVTWLGGAVLPEAPEETAGGKESSPPDLLLPQNPCVLGLVRGAR